MATTSAMSPMLLSSPLSIRFVLTVLLLSSPLSAQGQKTVTIFHFNDTHSYLFPWGEKVSDIPQNGAASRLIRHLNDLRQTAVNPVLLHGGDSFTGGMAFNRLLGRAEFALFDSIGVDAMVLGNHDFDIRPFRLVNAMVQSNARFPFLSANIIYNNDTSGLGQLVKPFIVKTIGNVILGVFGLTTRSTVSYGESRPITFDSTISTARRMVDSLKARNVDLIIALTHLGVSEDRQIARQVTGIDVIVGGHSHTPLSSPILEQSPSGDSTIIVQAGSKWEYLGMLEMTFGGGMKSWTYKLDHIGAPMPGDPAIDPYLESFRDSITAVYGPVFTDTVAVLTEEFPSFDPSNGDMEYFLLNLVVDAYRYATGADVALETGALLRQELHAGRITTSEIRNMLSWSYDPQQNLGKRLTVVRINGSTLKFILNFTLSYSFGFFGGGVSTTLSFQVSGLQYTIEGWGASPALKDVWIDGVPVSDAGTYSLALNEFVADLARQIPIIRFISRQDTTFGPDAAVAQYLRSISPFNPGAVTMGRIWSSQAVPQISFALEEGNVRVQWTSTSAFSLFNLYRRRSDSPRPPVKLNSTPLTQTLYLDPGPRRGELYEYQIEELRGDGARYLLPPQKYQVGGLPTSAYLRQNFPNPFNSSTTIIYGVPSPGRTSLRLYNVLGQQVKALVDTQQGQGEFEVSWDGKDETGRDAATGVYFLLYSTDTFQTTGRILLIR